MKSSRPLFDRLVSLDVFRGFIMLLLLFEGAWLFENLDHIFLGPPGFILRHFFHVPWAGLAFWDLIQPGFMFIAGASMYLSFRKRVPTDGGGRAYASWMKHIIFRSLVLFLLGVGLHWMYAGEPVLEMQNVLTQLAFTTLIAALLIRLKPGMQIGISIGILILSSLIYRLYSPDSPFEPGRNAGSALDILISGHADPDHWVSLNFLSTSAHTIWGVLAGRMLLEEPEYRRKIRIAGAAAGGLILVGLLMHATGFEPMIKRIATASFVAVSGGICLFTFLALHLLLDGREALSRWGRGLVYFFAVIGMNSILLYLFSQTVGMEFFYDFLDIYVQGIGGWLHIPQRALAMVTSLMLIGLEWLSVHLLAGKGIRIRI